MKVECAVVHQIAVHACRFMEVDGSWVGAA